MPEIHSVIDRLSEQAANSLIEKTVVVFVDDIKDLRDSYAHLYGQHFEVATAGSPEELLDLLPRLEGPAVVMLDMHLGPCEMTGDELVAHIRQATQPFPASIIVLSGDSSDDSKIRALKAGADLYLIKAADSRELLIAIITREIEKLNAKLRQHLPDLVAANLDPLTLLLNRRSFDSGALREIHRAQVDGVPVTCIMGDIDNFTQLNNTYGHPFGDEVLRQVARCIQTYTIRPTDLSCRYGGEEFCFLFPGADERKGQGLVTRLDAAVKRLKIVTETGEAVPVTISFGAYTLRADRDATPEETLEHLIKCADREMYLCKQARKRGERP